jgi:hypothetical protein
MNPVRISQCLKATLCVDAKVNDKKVDLHLVHNILHFQFLWKCAAENKKELRNICTMLSVFKGHRGIKYIVVLKTYSK